MSSTEASGLLFDGITAINRFTESGTRSFVNPIGTTRLLSLYFQNYLSLTTSGSNCGLKNTNNAALDIDGNTIVSGSLTVSSSVFLPNITTVSQLNIITVDTASGQLYYTASSAIGGGAGFPFSGDAIISGSLLISGSGLVVTGSIDVTGSISASSGTSTVGFFGTSSWSVSSSRATTSSFSITSSFF